ncbi:3-deoxy-D-manno-octulosonic acid kinase [Halomonas sp. ZH2S]|uniref:3-deoxy-D-manno-octulosonic acid kinase n=1 Tax=Vreelandella zhuhanensis TaxID=2684210 RepID=A0A7X3KR43_9GAMM|nr:3-deoxy-D-manno-octulosonic acid kinase [Halomonas zhuhanensis]MWJ29175.1 3-deoxy-D-manno-octulosonic acid kinase [Halomonas zhuhanensis]
MRLATLQQGKSLILHEVDSLWDAGLSHQIGSAWFEPDHWRRQGKVIGEAPGRGSSLFLDAGNAQWVLRPYRRGGLVARLSDARYLWTGLENTRAFRELRLTAELFERGLPVPRPVAASVTRHGLTYEAALITVRIHDARALADRLLEGNADSALLRRVGETVRRFHEAGLDHVDLNARNLLVDDQDQVWLIDLDRCRLRQPGKWQQSNLGRLERSVKKFTDSPLMQMIYQGYYNNGGN